MAKQMTLGSTWSQGGPGSQEQGEVKRSSSLRWEIMANKDAITALVEYNKALDIGHTGGRGILVAIWREKSRWHLYFMTLSSCI